MVNMDLGKYLAGLDLSKCTTEDGSSDISNAALAGARFVGIERIIWSELLRAYVPITEYQTPQERGVRILDIGCGVCPEALSLNRYFGKLERKGRDIFDDVEFIGVDIDEKLIASARFRYEIPDWDSSSIQWVPEPGYRFIPGDATKIHDLVQGRVDVLVYPHPEILHRDEVWAKIIDASALLQYPGDLVIATVRFPGEKDTIVSRFQPHYHIKIATENAFVQTGYSPQDERHKFVIMGLRR